MPSSIPLRTIRDTKVSAIGYGAMGLSGFYGEAVTSDEERFTVSCYLDDSTRSLYRS